MPSKNDRFLTEETRLLTSCGISGRRRGGEEIFDRKCKHLLLQKSPFSPRMSLKMIDNERATALLNSLGDFFDRLPLPSRQGKGFLIRKRSIAPFISFFVVPFIPVFSAVT